MQISNVARVAQKELLGFFSSLTAFIFFGVFLAVTLFIFFWVDTFFARNIADVRPMFEWMPTLFVFLVPALTMRMWSEERRSGTLEFLLTLPLTNAELVLGKFVACLALVGTALALTLPLPISVSLILGPIDWGPVFGGYVASIFLAAAYASIGLYVSARTDNQIVSLLISVLVCGLFLLIGADPIANLFNNDVGEVMKLLGAGSRFQSITRGVIDFRDLYYYVSITAVFLSLNVWGLEKLRWAGNAFNAYHRRWAIVTLLFIANFIAGNFWLQQIGWARADLTEGRTYSISQATRNYLSRLKEPLLLRGYFSKKTHPLLAPLVPQLRDLLKEYAIAGNGKVKVEIIDPMDSPDLEREAGEKYGIKPIPFQTASKYQTALTNSYFDVLVKYGDQYEKLNYRDLIEGKAKGEQLSVALRNPEYDITNAIKKVLYNYQGAGNPFLSIEQPVEFIGYISADDKLPAQILELKKTLKETLAKLQKQSAGKFSFHFIEPEADNNRVAKELSTDYGFKPMALSIFDPKTFWFYMILKGNNQIVQVSLPASINGSGLEGDLKDGLKRFSKGFMKTVGVWTPPPQDAISSEGLQEFSLVRQKLANDYSVQDVSLAKGQVDASVDLLLLLAPEKLKDMELFAVDQFLMKGGTVIVATSPFAPKMGDKMTCARAESGLDAWLKQYGIDISDSMVLDKVNLPLPIPMVRQLGSYRVNETQLVPYPYFVDVRQEGLGQRQSFTAGIDEILMSWASPIAIEKEKNKQRQITEILHSSPQSWAAESLEVAPQRFLYPEIGFPDGTDKGRKLLAVAVEGTFNSYYEGRLPPTMTDTTAPTAPTTFPNQKPQTSNTTNDQMPHSVIGKSPQSARIIVFSSPTFLSDRITKMASQTMGSLYLKSIDFLENSVDWCLADRDLLSIRGRSSFTRVLLPIEPKFQPVFEYMNYALALAGLSAVWVIRNRLRARTNKRYSALLQELAESNSLEEAKNS